MRKWDADFLLKTAKAKNNPQKTTYVITESIDNPQPVALSEQEQQEAFIGLITTFNNRYTIHQDEANLLLAFALTDNKEILENIKLSIDGLALIIQSFVDVVASYNSDEQTNVLIRRALVKSLADSASKNGFSFF